jgi:O-antigen/teichoic acid export membrane protein
MTEVRTRSISNVRWASVSQYGRLVVQLVGIAVFSRLLAPSDFGLLAMATIVTSFGIVFQNMGTTTALIQKDAPTEQLRDTVFWFNIVFGLIVGAIVALASHIMAGVFREPRLEQVLQLLAFVFPITSAGTTHLTLLERASRFRTIAWIETSSSTSGLGVALVAACYGFGVYSLVIQALITAIISTVLYWIYSHWRPSWRWDQKELRSILNFSGNLVAFRVVNYLSNNVDSMLIGHYLGSTDLGWYSMAFRIMLLPIQNVSAVVNRALFPVYSRESRADIGKYYLRALSLLAFIINPIVLGLWALRRPLVEVVLGEKWMPVADVLTWFGPLAWLECFLSSTGVVLMAIGRTDLLRNIGFFSAAIYIASFIIGLPDGIVGIAAAYCFANVFVFGVVFYVALKSMHMRMSDLARNIWRPGAIALTMGVIVVLADFWLAMSEVQAWLRLAILVPVGAALYFALTATFARDLLGLFRQVAWRAAP